MDHKKSLIPFTRLVLEKILDKTPTKTEEQGEKLKNTVDDVIMNDAEIGEKVQLLVEELMAPPPEPKWAVSLRASIRPTITLFLTLTFIYLVLGQVGVVGHPGALERLSDPAFLKNMPNFNEADLEKLEDISFKRWHTAFTTFLAIYGPIIGFWFGERTAEKKPPKA